MAKSKVYTRSGDKGETGLVGGSRLSKGSDLIDLYGEVDELNSHLGVTVTLLEDKNLIDDLHTIQVKLFDLGSNLACEPEKRVKFQLPQLSEDDVSWLEKKIDHFDAQLEPLKYFVLPGGAHTSALLHVCRTVCRRVERKLVGHLAIELTPLYAREYINRLSDYFFVLSRYLNKVEGKSEIYWVPKKS